ncbi:hypothetical protein MRB53_032153 [Persea americana]|uniref:Uncharacterized protein n=1 Tax=Persea americana TaxID=3435 RepID=A0ACC2KRM2_PERAE|nr:hypothetical protein MRB53_032153 [Persea americana]
MGKGRERRRGGVGCGFLTGMRKWAGGGGYRIWGRQRTGRVETIDDEAQGFRGTCRESNERGEEVRSLEVTEMGLGAERVMAEMRLGTAYAGWRSLKGAVRICSSRERDRR